MVYRPVVDSEPSSGSEIPTRLVEHPKARYVWFGVSAGLGIGLIVGGVGSLGSASDWWVPVMLFGMGVAAIAVGAVALRWGISADQDAVTITNTRRHTIPWTDLEDIVLVKVESAIDLGFHYMVFRTRAGKAIRPAAPTGFNRPGRTLPRLQHDLLAMRNRYAPPSP